MKQLIIKSWKLYNEQVQQMVNENNLPIALREVNLQLVAYGHNTPIQDLATLCTSAGIKYVIE